MGPTLPIVLIRVSRNRTLKGGNIMRQWTAPKVIEIPVGMEINSYACARR
jgi:coenzyme PQQ precursor peptide PqqA